MERAPRYTCTEEDKQLSSEGFRIRQVNGKLTVTSPSETGLLYAAYHLIRLQEMQNFESLRKQTRK